MTTSDLALRPTMTREQIDLLKRTICRDGTDEDLALFVGVCNATGLSPFLKQIYAVFRKESGRDRKTMTIQTGIDGLRLAADRTGKYAGQLSPEWCGLDGVWRSVWLDADAPPAAARVGVLRSGFRKPCYGIATWASYAVWERDYDKPGAMKLSRFWARMAPEQLAKCAEALALRKAFPVETGGLRSDDEMGQADNDLNTLNVVEGSRVETPKAIAEALRDTVPAPRPNATPAQVAETRAGLSIAERTRIASDKARADHAAKKTQNTTSVPAGGSQPPPSPAPPAGTSPLTKAGPVQAAAVALPATAAPATPVAPVSAPAGESSTPDMITLRTEHLVLRLGGERFRDLADALMSSPDGVRDPDIAEMVKLRTIELMGKAIFADSAVKAEILPGEVPTISQLLSLVEMLPLPQVKA